MFSGLHLKADSRRGRLAMQERSANRDDLTARRQAPPSARRGGEQPSETKPAMKKPISTHPYIVGDRAITFHNIC
jgi:hypothetical protein